MSTPETRPENQPAEDFSRTWRYKIGLGLIIIGNVGIVIGLLLPVLGLAPGGHGHAGFVGVLIVGGELLSLSSIVFLGKEGFKAIKSKAFAFVKTGYTEHVGRARHTIGIVLLLTHVLTGYIMVLYAWSAFGATTAEDPMPAIWGLNFAEQGSLYFNLFLIGELSFLVSLYVLGADWWERFRNIFVWKRPNG